MSRERQVGREVGRSVTPGDLKVEVYGLSLRGSKTHSKERDGMWTFETDPPFDPVDMTVVQTKNEKSLATESDGLRVTEPSVIKYIKQVKNKQVSPII